MEEHMYNGGHSAGVTTGKIVRPVKMDSTETVLIGNYDSAPRMYGALFSPGLRCDPEWSIHESNPPSGEELQRRREQAERNLYKILDEIGTDRTPDENKPWWNFWSSGLE